MLYRTHKKFGVLWGVLGLIISIMVGLIPAMSDSMRITDKIYLGWLFYVSMRGSIFGAEFPDIDSKGSIPSRHHPFIRNIFASLGIVHRGKFSHDFASLALFFGIILFGWDVSKTFLMSNVTEHQTIILGVGIWMIFILSKDLIDVLLYVTLKNYEKIKRVNMIAKVVGFLISLVLAWMLGLITFGSDPSNIVQSANFVFPTVTLWIIFTWVGAYSHLFADMLTKEGVNLFGKRIAPARVVLLVKKIPLIGRFLLPSGLLTGSGYEDSCRMVVVILTIPAVVCLFIVATGGDLQQFFALFT